MVFGAPLHQRIGTGISMPSVLISQNFKKENGRHFTAYGRSESTFFHILHDLGYIFTHQNHCYLYVRSLKLLYLGKIWQGRCTLLASLPKWEEDLNRLECEHLQLLTIEKGPKFETSSAKDTRNIRERIGQHLRG